MHVAAMARLPSFFVWQITIQFMPFSLSIDRLLSCFCVLATVSSAVVVLRSQVSLLSSYLNICPALECRQGYRCDSVSALSIHSSRPISPLLPSILFDRTKRFFWGWGSLERRQIAWSPASQTAWAHIRQVGTQPSTSCSHNIH